MCEVVSLQPTTTTLKLPAVWVAPYVAETKVCGDCGTALLTCTNAGAASADAVQSQVTAASAAHIVRATMHLGVEPATQAPSGRYWELRITCRSDPARPAAA